MPLYPHPDHRFPHHRTRWGQWLLWAMLGFTAVSAGALGALAALLLPRPIMPEDAWIEGMGVFRPDDLRNAQLDYALHILILGADDSDPTNKNKTREEELAGRSDTIMLARFDPAGKLSLLSIPRDTRVEIPDRGMDKINMAHAVGGPVLTARVVSQLLGDIPIDRYVRLSTDSIQALIDAMGGVEVFVPTRMVYTDVTQGLYIDLQPGRQRLTGEQAHHFIRFRHDELGDIGRVQRQQELIRALSRELLNPGTWTRTPQILQAIRDHIDTNLTWEELLSIAHFLLRSGHEEMDLVMLPGRFSQPQEYATSYWIPDSENIYQVAVNYFDAVPRHGLVESPPPSQLRIAVQNASGYAGMARRMSKDLERMGFRYVFAIVDNPQVQSTTEIIAQQGDSKSAREVQALLGLGEVKVESTGALESDITVKVGEDWVKYWFPEEVNQSQTRSSPTS
ncbi:MAG: LCP family protein [Synechococcaceae cyanobacterium SM2_3_1]|nr:LCP family protein [Synechococcaceae cyanobacterium SM2_3_1]